MTVDQRCISYVLYGTEGRSRIRTLTQFTAKRPVSLACDLVERRFGRGHSHTWAISRFPQNATLNRPSNAFGEAEGAPGWTAADRFSTDLQFWNDRTAS